MQQFDLGMLQRLPSDEQKQYIGEFLYVMISKIDPPRADKITGMILELDMSRLVHLLHSPPDLQEIVAKAQNKLQQSNYAPQSDRTPVPAPAASPHLPAPDTLLCTHS
jgi:polyadenylate-binding protein